MNLKTQNLTNHKFIILFSLNLEIKKKKLYAGKKTTNT